jgi:hypothetical protein
MIRKIIAALTGGKVVQLRDHDYEITTRLAYRSAYGWTAYRMSRVFGISRVLLLPDGTVKGASYVHEWKDAP